jgi:Ras-related protein Rab-28
MRAVKLDKHNGFADENDMYSYFVSAKTGDNVNSAFHRIAADWAGVVLTKPEMEIAAKPVVANIVNHARNAE